MSNSIGLVAKALVGAVMVALTALVTALTDGGVSGYEWTLVVGSFLAGLGAVWAADNKKWFKYAKMVTAVAVAVVAALGTAYLDGPGVSTQELLGLVIAAMTVIVGAVPNAETSDEFVVDRIV